MLFDFFDDLNWLAVIGATVAFFVLGFLWYADFAFGKQYRAAIGAEEGSRPEPVAIVVNVVAWFIAALSLALIAKAIGAADWVDGLVLGLVVSIGFIGTNRVAAQFYEGRNTALMRINGPYIILGFALMGVILGQWG